MLFLWVSRHCCVLNVSWTSVSIYSCGGWPLVMPAWPPALGTFLSHTPCSLHGNLNLSRRAQDKKYDSSFWQFWRGRTLFPGVTLGFICPEIWLLISPFHLMYYLPNFLPKSEKNFFCVKVSQNLLCYIQPDNPSQYDDMMLLLECHGVWKWVWSLCKFMYVYVNYSVVSDSL